MRQAMHLHHVDPGDLVAVAVCDPVQGGERRLGGEFGTTLQMIARSAVQGLRVARRLPRQRYCEVKPLQ